jgi:hypothetical protein
MSKPEKAAQPAASVVPAKNNLPSTEVLDFSADAGLGLEGAGKDSFALPFLAILQGLSPQIETVEGAKPGLFINTITNGLSASINVVPVAFQRRYLEWKPREKGGGFCGSHDVVSVETDPSIKKDNKGQLVNEEGNILKDTRMHYVLIVNDDGSYNPALISMSSTQVKKSKRWLSMIRSVQSKDGKGNTFNPPSFSHVYELTSLKEQNDKGTWYGYEIHSGQPVTDGALYKAAKDFHAQVSAGTVVVSNPPSSEAESNDKF